MTEQTMSTSKPAIQDAPSNTPEIVWQKSLVSAADRARLLKQRPSTIWFTGLSGAGKSTLAFALEHRLNALGYACFVLDGDNVRHGLNRDLGFSPEHRAENIRRIAEVAKLMNQSGLIVMTALISPYREDREMARQIIGTDHFFEIHVDASLQVCEQRDPKGLYRRARGGQIAAFTGISARYDVPMQPTLALNTGAMGIEHCVERVLDILVGAGKQ